MLASTETPDVVTRVLESPSYEIGDKKYPPKYCAQMFCKEIPTEEPGARRFLEMQFGEWQPTKLLAIDSLDTKIKLEGMKKVSP